MLLLVLLLLPSLSLSTLLRQGVSSGHPHPHPHPTHTPSPTPASPTSSHDIEDPSTHCIDIPCYKPIVWSNTEEQVCRFRKTPKTCIEKSEEVINNILMTDQRCQPVQIICICPDICAFSVLYNRHCADICTICQKC